MVTLSPNALTTVTLSLLQDNVALEDLMENVTLTIVPVSPDAVASNAVLKNELRVSILDTDGTLTRAYKEKRACNSP